MVLLLGAVAILRLWRSVITHGHHYRKISNRHQSYGPVAWTHCAEGAVVRRQEGHIAPEQRISEAAALDGFLDASSSEPHDPGWDIRWAAAPALHRLEAGREGTLALGG